MHVSNIHVNVIHMLPNDDACALALNQCLVCRKYSVNRSSYQPLVRVSQPLQRCTSRAIVRRTTAYSQVSENELFTGYHAVTNTKPAAARRRQLALLLTMYSPFYTAPCTDCNLQTSILPASRAEQFNSSKNRFVTETQ